uniref:BAR domain-containing protein n=1 Tax=Astyanax mexicanus TaxID=7994 RepID=A0A8B9GU16_ASTMX
MTLCEVFAPQLKQNLPDKMVSEKVGGAEGTKLDEDFKDLERKADVTSKAIVDVLARTSEYLQPNPGIISTGIF